jgi:hypothetical protein
MSKNQIQSSYMVGQEDKLDKKCAIASRYKVFEKHH